MNLFICAIEEHAVNFLLTEVVGSVDDEQRGENSGNFFDGNFFIMSQDVIHHVDELINSLFGLLVDNDLHEEMGEGLHEFRYILFGHFDNFFS